MSDRLLDAVLRNLNWFRSSGVMDPADGRWGVGERVVVMEGNAVADKITEAFYRVDKARSRETGGTGLGLAIAKSAVMMHRGNIKVSGKEGEGSVFVVRVPLNFVPE